MLWHIHAILLSCLESSRSFQLSLLTFPFRSALNAELFWHWGWNPVFWQFPRVMSLVKQTKNWTLMLFVWFFFFSYSSNVLETCLSKDKVLFAGVWQLQQSSTPSPGFLLVFFRCGDMIVAVNGLSTVGMSHSALVPMLKEQRNKVTLTVICWPGSLI